LFLTFASATFASFAFSNVFSQASYPTPDGTGVRDTIHVVDLADGHVVALNYLNQKGGLLTVNLGTEYWAGLFRTGNG